MTGVTLSPQNGVLFTDNFDSAPLNISATESLVPANAAVADEPATANPLVISRLFSWSDVAVADRDWLRKQTDDIQSLAYRTACDLIRIGVSLAAVRGRISRRTFTSWLAANLPWSRTAAYRMIQVSEAFSQHISHTATERIKPSALYVLSLPSTHPHARAHALEMASARVVTLDDAKRIIEQHAAARKAVPEPTRAELRDYDRHKKTLGIVDEKPAVIAHDESIEVRAWAALEKLFRQHDFVHISRIEDSEPNPEERTPASVRCMGGDKSQGITSQSGVGVRLIDVVLRLAGMEPKKTCQGACKRSLEASKFSASSGSKDGRNRVCLDCERARVKRYDRKKQAEKTRGKIDAGPIATMGTNMEVLAN